MEELQITGYRIIRELGSGGMATVYEAIQESLDRPVALKVMAPSLSANKDFAVRFLSEGRTVAKLSHPNIVAIFDIGEVSHRHYMAMEYLAGGDLKNRIRKGLTPDGCLRILKQIALALDYAFSKGVIHRDVKPENILFPKNSNDAKLADFGISKSVDDSQHMTATGMSIGTPYYMSPEQCQGAQDLDWRSDQYSLGIVFYEMLCGQLPYTAANTVAIVMKHVQDPVPELPAELSAYQPLLDTLLAKDRNHRFSSSKELIAAIDGMNRAPGAAASRPRGGMARKSTAVAPPRPAPGPGQGRAAVKPKRSGPLWAFVGAACAAVLAGATWYFQVNKTPAPTGGSAPPLAREVPAERAPGGAPASRPVRDAGGVVPPGQHPLAPVTAKVAVDSNVPNTRLYVNDVYRGAAPTTLTGLGPGEEIRLRGEADGYLTTEVMLQVPKSGTLDYRLVLEPETGGFALQISTDPPDAKIRILNIAPAYTYNMMLDPGRYHVEISKDGYTTKRQWVEITNANVSLRIPLDKAVGDNSLAATGCPYCPDMVPIPAGSFEMGDVQGSGKSDATPVHKVRVGKFWMSKTEITFKQWDACVAAGGCEHRPRDRGWGRGDRPVIFVNWQDANTYASWLSRKTGKNYRLPSEAEWEYAARAGSQSAFSWGDNVGSGKANCDGCGSQWDNNNTAPVMSFQPNRFGLYDMHGNVWEWTQDCWNGSYRGAPTDGAAWLTGDCSQRVLRGGSWYFTERHSHSSNRYALKPFFRMDEYGFRVVHD